MIDGFGQAFGQLVGEIALVDAEVGGEFRHLLQRTRAAQCLGNLLAGHRQVLAVADPRFDLFAQAGLLQDLLQRPEASDGRLVRIAAAAAQAYGSR